MRISDWSSDVCSSDLEALDVLVELVVALRRLDDEFHRLAARALAEGAGIVGEGAHAGDAGELRLDLPHDLHLGALALAPGHELREGDQLGDGARDRKSVV